MTVALFRLMALVAVLLMPVGMAGPAMAQPAPAASAGHCDEHQAPADEPAQPDVQCMACAALPAVDSPAAIADLRPQAPAVLSLADSIDGIEPEIATPPPKLS